MYSIGLVICISKTAQLHVYFCFAKKYKAATITKNNFTHFTFTLNLCRFKSVYFSNANALYTTSVKNMTRPLLYCSLQRSCKDTWLPFKVLSLYSMRTKAKNAKFKKIHTNLQRNQTMQNLRKMPRTIKMIAGRKLDKNLGNCYFGGKRCGSCLREELRAGRQSVFSATGGKFPIFSKEYLPELFFSFFLCLHCKTSNIFFASNNFFYFESIEIISVRNIIL